MKNLKTLANFFKKPSLFLGMAFFIPQILFAQLKIAVVDSGFCSNLAMVKSKKHEVLLALDMTKSNHFDCLKISKNELENSKRFHGQHVLNEFLKYLPFDLEIKIIPLIIYDKFGQQNKKAWENAIRYIESEKIDLTLSASGFVYDKKLVDKLPSFWFVPSGRVDKFIRKETMLFPQNLAPAKNLMIIGDYFDGATKIYDQSLLYEKQIDYYFPSGNQKFSGTSRAVSMAMARAIEHCFIDKKTLSPEGLRFCLRQNEKILKDNILKKEFKTF